MNAFSEPISEFIWDTKYRYRLAGTIIDQSIEDTWLRVSRAIAYAEKPKIRPYWQKEFYRILEEFRFLPGGRILAGAGTKHQVTLFNCFVMNIEKDSLKGIFKGLSEGAITLQQGGGVGYDFSILRPEGDLIKKTGLSSSGPISFMRIWDKTCSILLSTGARRGAMMGVMRCDHPDILKFIAAKEDPNELRHFNVSVMVSDAFMKALKNDADWALIFPASKEDLSSHDMLYSQWGNSLKKIPCRIHSTIKARDLWDKIIRSAYQYAEPGVLFSDTINRMNNLWYREHIHATNPCGEIPLPPYGACNLGAINLTQFVINPFSKEAKLNWTGIEETTRIATRFLDDVIDVSRYPLKMQREQAVGTRRIGLGITGLADAFLMLGIRYGDAKSLALAAEIIKRIAEVTWEVSIELAREKGAFPFFHPDYLHGEFVKTLPERICKHLKQNKIRNSHHNTIAPTGTISLLSNNVSNGIEPIFRAEYDRHVRTIDGATVFRVKDFAYRAFQKINKNILPPNWVDTKSLPPQAHLEIQAAVQPFIDNSISKTINIPQDFPFKNVVDVYTQAYKLNLKGCTIFRPNPVTGSVLSPTESDETSVDRCCQYD